MDASTARLMNCTPTESAVATLRPSLWKPSVAVAIAHTTRYSEPKVSFRPSPVPVLVRPDPIAQLAPQVHGHVDGGCTVPCVLPGVRLSTKQAGPRDGHVLVSPPACQFQHGRYGAGPLEECMSLLLRAKPLDGDASPRFPGGAGGAEVSLLPHNTVSGALPLEVPTQRLGSQLELVALNFRWGEAMAQDVVFKEHRLIRPPESQSPTPQMACSGSAGGRSVASITARIIELMTCPSPSCAVPGPRMTARAMTTPLASWMIAAAMPFGSSTNSASLASFVLSASGVPASIARMYP